MTPIKTEVLRRDAARFDMVGRRLPDNFRIVDERISQGLAKRLVAYALKDLQASGFDVTAWEASVETMDAEPPPSERYYTVRFTNPSGGQIGIQGIATRKGWPFLDHGIFVERA